MKKSKVVGTGCAVALCCALTMGLYGCGSSETPKQDQQDTATTQMQESGAAGHWTLAGANYNGTEVRGTYDKLGLAGDIMLDINTDGTFSIDAMGNSTQGTWSQNGDKITLSTDATPKLADLTLIDNNTMELFMTGMGEGQALVLEKTGEAAATSEPDWDAMREAFGGDTTTTNATTAGDGQVVVDDQYCTITSYGWGESDDYHLNNYCIKMQVKSKIDKKLTLTAGSGSIGDRMVELGCFEDVYPGKYADFDVNFKDVNEIPASGTTDIEIFIDDGVSYPLATYNITI